MSQRPAGVFGREDMRSATSLACDVVVVGSGAGGSALAAELAEGGLDVIVLEEGGYTGTEDFNAKVLEMTRRLYRDTGASATVGMPPVMFQEGRTGGGSPRWSSPSLLLAVSRETRQQ